MKVIDGLIQGSPDWHAFRAEHFNASEAAAVFGQHKYMSRADLLALKATGIEKEVNDFQQAAFDRGHATEALARPHVAAIIGEDLFPVVASDDENWLAASFDGITMDDCILFEHKLLNQDLVAQVKTGELEPHYYWQLEQQLLISGAEKVIFVTSDGTAENLHWMEYRPVAGRADQLIAGWKQFQADLANYTPEAPKVEIIGRAPDELPALHIEVTGMVTASNLEAFKSNAIAVFQGINRELSTDADFANAEKTVKWCKGVEDKLAAAKEHALSQTQSIDQLFKAIDSISAEARATRLELDKLVTSRKESVRLEILQAAQQSLFEHMETLNKRLGGKVRMPNIVANFTAAMKGKRTVSSLKDACDTELARVKIESSQIADSIEINLNSLRELASDHGALFADAQQLVMKANDDLVLLIQSRITAHEAAEKARIDAKVAAQLAEEQRKTEQERLRLEAIEREARLQAEAVQRKAEEDAFAAANKQAATEAKGEPVVAEVKTEDAPAPITQKKASNSRPSDAQLRKAIAMQFGVDEPKADAWLREYGFVSAA